MKLISAGEAVGLIQDGMTIGVGGFGAYAAPETILQAMADSFAAHGHPASLTVTCGVSPGDNTNRLVGLNRIASEGLLDTIIAGHFANPPLIAEMVARNQVADVYKRQGLHRPAAGHRGCTGEPLGTDL